MWDAVQSTADSPYAEGVAGSASARTRGSHELFGCTASLWAWYRLGGRSSSRVDVANTVRDLDVRQAAPEGSGCLERPGVNVSIEITRRLSESEKIAQRHRVMLRCESGRTRIRHYYTRVACRTRAKAVVTKIHDLASISWRELVRDSIAQESITP